MSYLVFARKYRPQTFDEVIGQEDIIKIIRHSIKRKVIHHAFLFSGPRGIGKTSCARILAKVLNCKEGLNINPCNKCINCREITEGKSLDVIEIDGASNRGIDEIRSLREAVKFAPVNSPHKVYIIDEVHQITKDAFNALLKTLEEPPPHVKFIFATTQPEKVPPTIMSRCQKFAFRPLSVKAIFDKLKVIVKNEKLKISDDVLLLIAQAARGSIRDAESMLDQISALSMEQDLSVQELFPILGVVEHKKVEEVVRSIANFDSFSALQSLGEVVASGLDLSHFTDSVIEYFRNLLIIKISPGAKNSLLQLPDDVITELKTQADIFTVPRILTIIEAFIDVKQKARILHDEKLILELAVVHLTQHPHNNKAVNSGGSTRVNSYNADTGKNEVSTKSVTSDNAAPKSILGSVKVNFSSGPIKGIKDGLDKIDDIIKSHKGSKQKDDKPFDALEITLDEVKSIWEKFHDILEKEKKFLHSYLESSAVKGIKNNVVTVLLSNGHKFHKEHLEQTNNISFLESVLSKLLKKRVALKFEISSKNTVANSPSPPIKKEEPVYQKPPEEKIDQVLKVFNGEVVNKDRDVSPDS